MTRGIVGSMISIPSPFSDAPGIVRLPGSPSITPADLSSELRRGVLNRPFILDNDGMRHLLFDSNAVQSSMRMEDPAALVTAYVQKMTAFLLFNRQPGHIVLLGLGGGSLVKFCHRHLPLTRLTVLEVDPQVLAMRVWFHIPPDDERLQVVLGDGADYVRRADWSADVLLIDAFDAGGVAPSLDSGEFYASAFRGLGPDGLLVMNLAGARHRYCAHLEHLRKAFPGPVLLVPVEGDGNLLIFAFGRSGSGCATHIPDGVAEELESELALEFPRFLRRLRAGHVL